MINSSEKNLPFFFVDLSEMLFNTVSSRMISDQMTDVFWINFYDMLLEILFYSFDWKDLSPKDKWLILSFLAYLTPLRYTRIFSSKVSIWILKLHDWTLIFLHLQRFLLKFPNCNFPYPSEYSPLSLCSYLSVKTFMQITKISKYLKQVKRISSTPIS